MAAELFKLQMACAPGTRTRRVQIPLEVQLYP